MNFRKREALCIIFVFLFSVFNFAQEANDENKIREILDEIIEDEGSDEKYEYRFEQLYSIYQNKININQASFEDLTKLYFLSEFQILSLLDYIEKTGEIYSIYELQTILPFNKVLIEKLQLFIRIGSVETNENLSKAINRNKQEVIIRYSRLLEKSEGFLREDSAAFLGSPDKMYLKYQFDAKSRIKFGFVADKDAGEEFFTGSNEQGFDFNSFHLQIDKLSIFERINIGDYHANFGQGLVIQTSPLFGGGSYVLNNYQKNTGIKKFSSANEYRFLRGLAFQTKWNKLDFTLFTSYKTIDANFEDNSIVSTPISGLHQTNTNLLSEDNVQEKIAGMHLLFDNANLKLGLTAAYAGFSNQFTENVDLYKQFVQLEKDNFNASVDYRARMQNTIVFGEIATNVNLAIASYNGFLFLLSDKISLLLSHRYLDKNYTAYFSETFSKTGLANNENGIYAGLEFKPINDVKISTFVDVYKFPWLRYNTSSPSEGFEIFLQSEYTFQFNSSIKLAYKLESKPKNEQGIHINYVENDLKNYIRFDYKYSLSSAISMVHRIDFVSYNFSNEISRGYLFYTDVAYKFQTIPLSMKLRYSFFNTDSYDSRIYTYESDVLYSFSVPAFYDKGFRYYALFQYKWKSGISIWFRLSQTHFADLKTIGTGLNEIEGNKKSEIKFQVMYKF